MRPALILYGAGGDERRLLAELEDKPWEAQDGEPWRATFPLDGELDAARAVELAVAPDIVVAVRGRAPRRADPRSGSGRRPRIALDVPSATRGAGDRDRASGERTEADRLAGLLATAETALARERERRGEAERALESRRAESLELSAELGRTRTELTRVQANEREVGATSDLLQSSRREHQAAEARYDALAAEHERVLGDQARLREELEARTGELGSTRDALATAREELRAVPPASATRIEPEARAEHESRAEPGSRAQREPRLDPDSRAEREPWAEPEPWFDPEPPAGRSSTHPSVGSQGVLPHTDRPLNPSLRSRSWPLRLLAVIVLAAVVVAVYVILHSTVLH